MSAPVPSYAERLWPGPLGWSLVPASAVVAAIVLAPVDLRVAAAGAAVALVAGVVVAVVTSTAVQVAGGELRVGAAHVPLALLGEPVVLDRAGVRTALGPGSDARAFVCVRAWLDAAVVVPVEDPADPTPSWFISTRRPAELAAAVDAGRQAHSVQTS